jgi:hypothetical protein
MVVLYYKVVWPQLSDWFGTPPRQRTVIICDTTSAVKQPR